eukprot:CAMPEP_0172425000 /NCGR_PEP_ID=MMETSP1064-20121228/29405_1 /TAXON_ID=202472 /ORGANISM="Aulacoseira subarctica , Strain CCAP 1002/5" /LENGTH=89 /DNA_ID=CAMNT_0013167521 /DNA_START=164 /DNA_END=429 /DNA_ORIENTATION=-
MCERRAQKNTKEFQLIKIKIFQGKEASEPPEDAATTPPIEDASPRSPTPDYLTCGSQITANFDDIGDMWIARLDELTAYKQKHGNCLVP